VDITAVRQAVATQIQAVIPAPFVAYWFQPDMPTVPACWIQPTDVKYDLAYGPHGLEQIDLDIVVLVSRADDQSGQAMLDKFLHGTGAYSLKAAVEAGRAQYGGTAYTGLLDDLWVKDMDRYQHWQAGDTVFLGASLHVMVIGSGNA
jgi:hypothetical protein